MSSNKNTYDPIAIPCQYSRPSVLGTNLDSLEVQSGLKDSYKQLIVLDSRRSFVSKCPMAGIRCRLSNSVTSPVASSFGNVSLRRGSTDNGESYSCPGDLSNRLKQLILFIFSDIKKTQKINPAEIDQFFDDISCSKGGSVIRKLSAYLAEDIFLEGIRQNLEKYAYGNASSGDLWAQLSETSGQDVSEFMNLWTKHTGYPVLRAEREGNTLQITQTRFLSSGDVNEEEKKQLWWNPLGLLTTGQTKASQEILHEKTAKIELPESADYFILNYGFNSVFRVQYPADNPKKLGELISKKEVLSSVDRIALVSDAGSLAQAGYGPTTSLLELLLNFRDEEEYVVWREICNFFRFDFSCQKDLDDIEKFFDGRDTKSIDMALKQTLENVTIYFNY